MGQGDGRLIACVLLPHLHWQVAASSDPRLKDVPMIVGSGAPGRSHRVVADFSPDVQGVLAGMPLEQALSRNPDAVLVAADTPAVEALFDQVLTALEKVVPEVEDAEPGVAYLDIRGVQRLYGGNIQVVRAVSSAVKEVSDLDLRIGIGSSKWLAYVAAVHSRLRTAYRLTSPSGSFLRALPVSILPLGLKTVARMEEFGLHLLGDIATKPRGAMHAQFGQDGALAWDLSNGIDASPLVPRRLVETVSEYLEFSDATVNLINILAGIESLLSRAFSRPLLRNRHARRCELEAQIFEAAHWALEVAFKEPAGSKAEALFAVKAKLDTVEIPGPLEDLRVTLSGLTGEPGRQESMWLDVKRQDDLSDALAQLEERIGEPPPVYRVQAIKQDSKVPEWRSALVQLSR